MRRALSWLVLVAAGLLLAACANPTAGSGSTTATSQVLAPNQVQAIADAGVPLIRPADGRIRGYGFAAVVTGVGTGHQAGGPGVAATVVASGGHHLVVFALGLTTFSTPDPVGDGTSPVFTADLLISGGHVDFDTTDLVAGGRATYVASVPDGSEAVDLELTAAGLTQSFSLTSLHRVGVQPAALYRDPNQSWLTVPVNQTQSIPATVPADGFTSQETLGITSLTLTDFQPGDPTVHPADPNQAYLAIAGTDTSDPNPPAGYPSGSHFVGNFSALPGADLTLTLPDGQSSTATHVGSSSSGLLDGTYYFTVPSDLTSAALSIAPGSQLGAEYQVFTGNPATVDFSKPAAFTLDLPPVPTPSGATVPANASSGGGAAPTPTGNGSSNFEVALLLMAGGFGFVIVVSAAAILKRRRKLGRGRGRPSPGQPPFRPLRPIAAAPVVLALPAGPPSGPVEIPGGVDPADDGLADDALDQPGAASAAAFGVAPASSNGAWTSVVPPPSGTVGGSAVADSSITPGGSPAGLVEVLVLGPVEVTGWRVRPRRKVVTALLCYLCLHPGRPITSDRLLTALWPLESARPEASRASLHTYASELRRSLPEGCLPDAGTTDGYLLTGGVATDWATFTSLVDEAKDADPASSALVLDRALSLVRGVPFDGATSELFEWTTVEHHTAAIEVAVAECAHWLVSLRLATGDGPGAEEAARRGLVGVPDSAVLHADLIRAATICGDPAGIRRAWKGARRMLGEDGVARLVSELERPTSVHQPAS